MANWFIADFPPDFTATIQAICIGGLDRQRTGVSNIDSLQNSSGCLIGIETSGWDEQHFIKNASRSPSQKIEAFH